MGAQLKNLMAMLYRQLAGKAMTDEEKDDHELQAMLVQAMAEKHRVLVVLDDPWQVRFLNPIDSVQKEEHRLLVTTRIRDLVPKAMRVDLPLMGADEAVALLLELANIEEVSYLKEHPGSAWPPQAAYTIAAECGLLPITLTIAAQVVRSWGADSVLPLLREQEGSGASTLQERVIGAGLRALEKNKDGAAVKELFHMFAVTQEDFVHPIVVIEFLWRSCCAPESEKQEGSLTTRLKVRQWTQMLVDHSLLLGSSTEGIHLHDLILQYLRKRLSAEELRVEQRKVVEGMVAASRERPFEESGTERVEGEECDWYCSNVAAHHISRSLDPDIRLVDDEQVKRWIAGCSDPVLVRRVALALGTKQMSSLGAHYIGMGKFFEAAKVEWSLAHMAGLYALNKEGITHLDATLLVLKRCPTETDDALQLELGLLEGKVMDAVLNTEDRAQILERIETLRMAKYLRRKQEAYWGVDGLAYRAALKGHSFDRHQAMFCAVYNVNVCMAQGVDSFYAEYKGDLRGALEIFQTERTVVRAYLQSKMPLSIDFRNYVINVTPAFLASEMESIHHFRTDTLRLLGECGCHTPHDMLSC
eukprot:g255.t1